MKKSLFLVPGVLGVLVLFSGVTSAMRADTESSRVLPEQIRAVQVQSYEAEYFSELQPRRSDLLLMAMEAAR